MVYPLVPEDRGKDFVQVDAAAGEDMYRHRPGFIVGGGGIDAVDQKVDMDQAAFGVNDPVFRYAYPLVEVKLDQQVVSGG
jgi:hypothetical protein